MSLFFLFAVGIYSVISFHEGRYFPIWLSVAVLTTVTVLLWKRYQDKRIGQLILLYWLIFALPFIHIPPYLFYDFEREAPFALWGFIIRPYMLEERIIELTAMIGATGAISFCIGAFLHGAPIDRDKGLTVGPDFRGISSMSMPIWLIWVAAGTLLSWLVTPTETLFTAQYAQGNESVLDNASFGSAVMVSYTLLAFALSDMVLDQNAARKSLKRKILLLVVLYILFYLQLLRGSRTAVPFVLGCLLTYFYWGAPLLKATKKKLPWLYIAGGGFALVVISMLIGTLRSYLTYVDSAADLFQLMVDLNSVGKLGFSNLLHGTWSAILLTPLSVAGDHIYDLLPLKLGKDYKDIFLSLPPGFVADALGYTRPLSKFTGPSFEMRYGMGGTHYTVLPFMNFRMIGVLIIPGILAYLLTAGEKKALHRLSALNLTFLCMLASSGPHFLWYAEKYGINTVIIWAVLAVCYRVSLSLRPLSALQPSGHASPGKVDTPAPGS